MPTCWIVAGPNGAGETTFAIEFLPGLAECLHFLAVEIHPAQVVRHDNDDIGVLSFSRLSRVGFVLAAGSVPGLFADLVTNF